MQFDYSLNYTAIDFRKHPELYRVGRGEQGVLLVEPYKSEILPFWKFRTPPIAEASAKRIYELFLEYKEKGEFVGMDMARKFLQMGYTRSRRYANYKGGKKYVDQNREVKHPQRRDWATNEKAQSARIFYGYYVKAREDLDYKRLRTLHKTTYETENPGRA